MNSEFDESKRNFLKSAAFGLGAVLLNKVIEKYGSIEKSPFYAPGMAFIDVSYQGSNVVVNNGAETLGNDARGFKNSLEEPVLEVSRTIRDWVNKRAEIQEELKSVGVNSVDCKINGVTLLRLNGTLDEDDMVQVSEAMSFLNIEDSKTGKQIRLLTKRTTSYLGTDKKDSEVIDEKARVVLFDTQRDSKDHRHVIAFNPSSKDTAERVLFNTDIDMAWGQPMKFAYRFKSNYFGAPYSEYFSMTNKKTTDFLDKTLSNPTGSLNASLSRKAPKIEDIY